MPVTVIIAYYDGFKPKFEYNTVCMPLVLTLRVLTAQNFHTYGNNRNMYNVKNNNNNNNNDNYNNNKIMPSAANFKG